MGLWRRGRRGQMAQSRGKRRTWLGLGGQNLDLVLAEAQM